MRALKTLSTWILQKLASIYVPLGKYSFNLINCSASQNGTCYLLTISVANIWLRWDENDITQNPMSTFLLLQIFAVGFLYIEYLYETLRTVLNWLFRLLKSDYVSFLLSYPLDFFFCQAIGRTFSVNSFLLFSLTIWLEAGMREEMLLNHSPPVLKPVRTFVFEKINWRGYYASFSCL